MTAIAIIAGLIALVWGAAIFLRGGLVAGCLTVLLAGICFGYPFFHLSTEPIPLTADRVLWVVLMGQYVVWRRWGLAQPKPMGAADWTLAAFLAALAASTFLFDWHSGGAKPLARLLFYYLMPIGLYWVARQAAVSERAVLGIFACLAAFGLYVAATAVAEVHQAWWAVYPKYIADASNLAFFGRGRGPLLNPVGTGVLAGAGLVALLLWWPRANAWGRLLLAATAMLLFAGIYATYTRTAWMGAGLGVAVLAALTLPRSWRALLLGGGLTIAVLLAATQWESILAFKRDRGHAASEAADSVELRPILATVAWHMFLDRPWLGCGLAGYDQASKDYFSDRSTELPLEKARPYTQHSVFLSLLAETGILGAGSFVILLGLWARDAWRLWRATTAPLWARQQGLLLLAVLAVYLPNGVFHDVSIIPMVNMGLFFLAGVTAGLRPWASSLDVRGSP